MPARAPYLRALERLADAVRRQAETPEREARFCQECDAALADLGLMRERLRDGCLGYAGVSPPLREALRALDVAKAETSELEKWRADFDAGWSAMWRRLPTGN